MSFVKANIAYAYYNAVFYQRIRREGGGERQTERERERERCNKYFVSVLYTYIAIC